MDNSICRYDAPMRGLLEAINEEPIGTAFIVDDEGKVCGVLTDGDFRRMLLNGRSLEQPLSKDDINPSFVFATEDERFEEVLKKTDTKVRVVPILNSEGRLVNYFRYDHNVKMMPVAEPKLNGNEFKYLSDAFLSTWISSAGAYINRFEKDFSEYCGAKHGVAVSNGTVAIHLAIVAMGIGEGDEVIVPDLTFAATINAVLHAGATPVIVDVDEQSWCISPQSIKEAITTKTKAIIPVHVYGQPCDMDAIMQIADENDLYVIEDAAEAHGAEFKGRRVGSIGHAATFSFFGNKIITTGEGGMVLTNSDELNDRMRVLRDHGMSKEKRYWHDHVGFNYRMTNLQAAIGCAQLERIESILETRSEIERNYVKILSHYDFAGWQHNIEGNRRVTWLVCVMLDGKDRDTAIKTLRENGVDGRPFFYQLSEMPLYAKYAAHECPVSSRLSKSGLNLPTIDNIEFDRVARAFDHISKTKL
jgi:perosamine synthetase